MDHRTVTLGLLLIGCSGSASVGDNGRGTGGTGGTGLLGVAGFAGSSGLGGQAARPSGAAGVTRDMAAPPVAGTAEGEWACAGEPSTCRRSCLQLAATCGPNGDGDCCASTVIPGGTFLRTASTAVEVSAFRLDVYEVTVGRFRRFAAAFAAGWRPSPGSGKNPNNAADRGWDSSWSFSAELLDPAECGEFEGTIFTRTPLPGTSEAESRPQNCMSWFEAFAFCIWDGGRLPTEAEWAFAAAGGGDSNGQRVFPWSDPPSSTELDPTFATFDCLGDGEDGCSLADVGVVGSRPRGNARWGQADMAGNVNEWVQDYFRSPYRGSGTDWANLSVSASRVTLGGGWGSDPAWLRSSERSGSGPGGHLDGAGARCARRAP